MTGLRIKDKMKKILVPILAALVAVTALPPAASAAENDYATRGEVVSMLLSAADDYNPDVQKSDIIRGYGDGDLQEDKTVTRAEAMIMLGRAFGGFPELKGDNLRMAIPKEEFTDIPQWAEAELAPVLNAGIIAGTGNGRFSPDDPVTTGQMETAISRVYALYGTVLQDSFYSTVNRDALDTLEIPAGSTIAGSLYGIMDLANQQVTDLIRETSSSSPAAGSAQEKIKILYDNITDMDARNAAGITPIENDLEAIDSIRSVSGLDDVVLLEGTASALSILANFSLTVDPQDSSSYMTVFLPASASLAKEIYSGQSETQKNAYLKYITTLLTLCGEEKEEAEADAQAFFDFEKQIADASLSVADQYDLSKVYNIYSLDQLKSLFSAVDLQTVFDRTELKDDSRILVQDVGKMTQVARMLTDENIDGIKNYLKIALIGSCADVLSEDFREAKILYNQESLGTEGSVSLEEEAATLIAQVLPDYVGEIYAEKYCSDEIISDVTEMIHDVIDIYRKRIAELDWMSEATKEQALRKLDTLRIHVGAPDYSQTESALDSADLKSGGEGGSYYQNIIEINKASLKELAELSGEPVDKEQWVTTPQTVNAFYSPSFNSVNFPIAFLQAPVYDPDASYEENLGSVGFVIAHEITHAFDSSGSQYDENGNAANWWTEGDLQTFQRLCQDVVTYFDGVETAPGITVNGALTLTENIADLGAIQCVVSIGEETPDFDFREMFESYAVLWMSTSSREYLEMASYLDTHSPSRVRVDRVLQSTDKFYDVYGITEGDGMYVAPEDRVRIW